MFSSHVLQIKTGLFELAYPNIDLRCAICNMHSRRNLDIIKGGGVVKPVSLMIYFCLVKCNKMQAKKV